MLAERDNSPKPGLRRAAAGTLLCFWVVWVLGFFLSIKRNAPLDFLEHGELFLAGRKSSASLTGMAPVLEMSVPG